jgi:hypothetical protein
MATTYAILDGRKYMNTVTYTGNGTNTTSITGVGFQTDFNWTKSRSSGSYSNQLSDVVRGFSNYLYSNATTIEGNDPTNHIQSVNSDGYVINSGASFNASGVTYVAWNWKAGSSTVTNSSGTISSQVSANPTSGFSVVTYTGTGALGTVGHGLGVAPNMIIIKGRTGMTNNWSVYHSAVGNTGSLFLNLTNATDTGSAYWNNTSPTSSVFTIYLGSASNTSGQTHVAYCFAAVAGYSAFGSYTGNGSTDGPFVYLGFRPRYVMTKRTDSSSNWYIQDTSRSSYNVQKAVLFSESSSAETTDGGLDFFSNGFKLRNTDASENASGGTYIYMAFAENPFKYANAR